MRDNVTAAGRFVTPEETKKDEENKFFFLKEEEKIPSYHRLLLQTGQLRMNWPAP
jgi:hypothetical protein